MPNSRPAYPLEFRRKLIALYRSGRSIESLARKFEPCANTISNWIRQADLDEDLREDGLTTDEKEELRRLRRENKRLKEEREVLKSTRLVNPGSRGPGSSIWPWCSMLGAGGSWAGRWPTTFVPSSCSTPSRWRCASASPSA